MPSLAAGRLVTVIVRHGATVDARREVKVVVRQTGQRRLDRGRQIMDATVTRDVVTPAVVRVENSTPIIVDRSSRRLQRGCVTAAEYRTVLRALPGRLQVRHGRRRRSEQTHMHAH